MRVRWKALPWRLRRSVSSVCLIAAESRVTCWPKLGSLKMHKREVSMIPSKSFTRRLIVASILFAVATAVTACGGRQTVSVPEMPPWNSSYGQEFTRIASSLEPPSARGSLFATPVQVCSMDEGSAIYVLFAGQFPGWRQARAVGAALMEDYPISTYDNSWISFLGNGEDSQALGPLTEEVRRFPFGRSTEVTVTPFVGPTNDGGWFSVAIMRTSTRVEAGQTLVVALTSDRVTQLLRERGLDYTVLVSPPVEMLVK